MLVTKNFAELCVLLVSEIYGQLPTRIIAALFSKGRLTTTQLAVNTSLNQRQVRHGLAVLVQQNVLFHLTDPDTSVVYYDVNPDALYNLVRSGKILEMVRDKYGDLAKKLVQDVFVLGHIKIPDLVEAYGGNSDGEKNSTNGVTDIKQENSDDEFAPDEREHVNGVNGIGVNGSANSNDEAQSQSSEQTYLVLARLLAAGILEPVTSMMFQSPTDLKTAVEQEVIKSEFPTGIRGIKQKKELDAAVAQKVKDFQQGRTNLKRRLEAEFDHEASVKRRKLLSGKSAVNGDSGSGAVEILMDHLDTIVRVNYDKCLVELRNLKLAQYVDDLIGETTAQVYATMLSALSKKINRCQVDPMTKTEDDVDTFTGAVVNTLEIFEHLSPSIDVSAGIGHPAAGTIDHQCAEKIRRFPPKPKDSVLQSTLEAGDEFMESDDEDYDRSDEIGFGANGSGELVGTKQGPNGVNGEAHGVDDTASVRAQRMRQMRQHLLLLAESKQGFIRHCGGENRGEWTVDFEHLMDHLRLMELDILIEQSFGHKGLRLVRVLREKGKLDDKILPNIALMRKADVHVKMAEMEMAGFLDVQEVPRDNQRAAARTIFLWFFDQDRTLKRTLDNAYKAMVRCLQRLEVERRKKSNVLAVTGRKDVQGKEEEKLRGDVFNEYQQFLAIEQKLLGQVSKLDDLVAVFRDY